MQLFEEVKVEICLGIYLIIATIFILVLHDIFPDLFEFRFHQVLDQYAVKLFEVTSFFRGSNIEVLLVVLVIVFLEIFPQARDFVLLESKFEVFVTGSVELDNFFCDRINVFTYSNQRLFLLMRGILELLVTLIDSFVAFS